MSLYLCVFAGDREVDGVEVGPYGIFNALREAIVRELEGGIPGSRFPTFILHSDCAGEWPAAAAAALGAELAAIAAALSLGERFVDVDGEPLLARLQALVAAAQERRAPILFQ